MKLHTTKAGPPLYMPFGSSVRGLRITEVSFSRGDINRLRQRMHENREGTEDYLWGLEHCFVPVQHQGEQHDS